VITGASRGLGAALAQTYAKQLQGNVTLSLLARSRQNLADCQQRCEHFGARVHSYACDIADTDAVLKLLSDISGTPVDVAFINAGTTGNSVNRHEPWQQQESIVLTNLLGAMASCEALLPAMRAQRRGAIVFISSISAYRGLGLTPSYCASKAGIKSYAESIRGDLAHEGIEISTVLPGFIQTDMSNQFQGARPFMLTAEQAANIIIRGVSKQRSVISFPRVLSYSQRLLHCLPARWADRLLISLGYGSIVNNEASLKNISVIKNNHAVEQSDEPKS